MGTVIGTIILGSILLFLTLGSSILEEELKESHNTKR
jgi:hypothetical protein